VSHSVGEGCVEPIYRSSNVAIYQGDVLIVLPQLTSASVNAVIADPPYAPGPLTALIEPGRHPATNTVRLMPLTAFLTLTVINGISVPSPTGPRSGSPSATASPHLAGLSWCSPTGDRYRR
jgi:hypothetical protein